MQWRPQLVYIIIMVCPAHSKMKFTKILWMMILTIVDVVGIEVGICKNSNNVDTSQREFSLLFFPYVSYFYTKIIIIITRTTFDNNNSNNNADANNKHRPNCIHA